MWYTFLLAISQFQPKHILFELLGIVKCNILSLDIPKKKHGRLIMPQQQK